MINRFGASFLLISNTMLYQQFAEINNRLINLENQNKRILEILENNSTHTKNKEKEKTNKAK